MKTADFNALREKAHSANNRNFTLLNALYHSERRGLETLDFDDCLWKDDFEETNRFLIDEGIEEFTVTSGSNNILDFFAYFCENGWRMAGMTKLPGGYQYPVDENGELKKVAQFANAIKFSRN